MCRAALTPSAPHVFADPEAATSVLDIGTGGGERLLSFADVLPADTVATEGWAPNVPVATANLAPRGIAVVPYGAGTAPAQPMPFPDRRFDLILDRHEAFDAPEIARTLRPGGVFLTQQVGADNFVEAHELFGAPVAYPDSTLAHATAGLEAAGLRIDDAAAWRGRTTFVDVGALLGYFARVPWDVPADFSVDVYRDVLLRLHHGDVPLAFTQSRFWLRAHRP